ncbi:MAG: hypothetical protein NVS3B20_07850 [Polyangiales bacterium]
MKSILIVEDEASVAEAFAIFLTSEGYRTQIATNGEEALATLEEFRPDLVISDVIMPVMDGNQLIRAMKAHHSYASIPVLLMSGAPSFARDAPKDGMIRLQKPFALEVLLGVIEQMLPR